MNALDTLATFLADLPLYVANGALVTLYALAGLVPLLSAAACAALVMLGPDAEVQARAGFRPRRGDRGMDGGAPRTAQVMTGLVLAAWAVAQWGMGAPVPWLGAAMWLAGLVGLLMLPAQRFNLLWMVKSAIALYALTVIAGRLYLTYMAHLSAEQWAALIGSTESAAVTVASMRSNVTTALLWAMWLVVPSGFFALMLQQFFVNPMSIVSPMAGAGDVLRRLRQRR